MRFLEIHFISFIFPDLENKSALISLERESPLILSILLLAYDIEMFGLHLLTHKNWNLAICKR